MSVQEDPQHVPHDHPELTALILQALSSVLDVPAGALEPQRSLREQGLDSVGATALVAKLGAALDRSLSPVLVWQHPTVARLASHLSGASTARPLVRPISASHDEPIAIVGMACRLPGGVTDPESFWKLLVEGVDAISEVPADRWDVDAWYDPDGAPGKMNTRWGGFLDAVDGFEPGFFGISPREAEQMDPQQRLMLELSWEALEDTGTPPSSLRERAVGVFAGVVFNDYATLRAQCGPVAFNTHSSTGHVHAVIANRVSYVLGLSGPSMVVDTACSSSLVSVHLAAQSLRTGECELALAGGVHVMSAPETFVSLTGLGALSPTGRSYTFDARADGFVRGEGGGVVVLKVLSAALRDGDRVYAVLKGSAVNNDGPSNGLAAPRPEAQGAVHRAALARAGVEGGSVDYVELHGTGTKLGDPIEASALSAVYGMGRPLERPLRVGSVKTNIGHLEAAAGVAGLMKAALSLHHGQQPASLNHVDYNPYIDPEALNLEVVRSLSPWPSEPGRTRRAGVSSFGFGGTNAHVVLEEAPHAFPHVSAEAPALVSEPSDVAGPVFVFGGLGPAWQGMGRHLYGSASAFRAVFDRCDAALGDIAGWSLVEELFAEGAAAALSDVDRHDRNFPLVVACEIALAAQWRAWGVEPSAVVGHSMGEVAAAQVAGFYDVASAMRVIHALGVRHRATVEAGGVTMGFVGAPEHEVATRLPKGEVYVAAVNDPGSCVISGHAGRVAEVMEAMSAEGIFARELGGLTSHCPLLVPLIEDLPEQLVDVPVRSAEIPMMSAWKARWLERLEVGGGYWFGAHAEPVRFREAIEALLGEGHRDFLELSPHGILTRSIQKTMESAGVVGWVEASQLRDEDGLETLHRVVGSLQARGVSVDGCAVTGQEPFVRDGSPELLVLSSRSAGGLRGAAEAMVSHLEAVDTRLCDIAWSSATRRDAHAHRLSVVASSRAEAVSQLRAWSGKEEPKGVSAARVARHQPTGPVFVFSGQGGQWLGMGRELYAQEEVFRQSVEGCFAAFAEVGLGFDLRELWFDMNDISELTTPTRIQPVLFTWQVSMAALWRSWGVRPSMVVGHSLGEVSAAFVSGALTIHEAARVVCTRSRIATALSDGSGAMAVVALNEQEVNVRLATHSGLSVGICNAPGTVVVSGLSSELTRLMADLSDEGVWCRRVKMAYASHSPQMDPLLPELEARLSSLRPREGSVPFFSTVTVGEVSGTTLDGGYWAQNLRQPVRFAQCVQAIASQGLTHFVELSPHPVLVTAIRENLSAVEVEGLAVVSARRQESERDTLLSNLGALWARGQEVDWSSVFPLGGRRVDLPKTAWQRERHWLELPEERPSRPGRGRARALPWHHVQRWRSVAPERAPLGDGAVAILLDGHGVGLALAARLRAAGRQVLTARRCQAPEPLADIQLDPTKAGDFAGLRESMRTGDMSLAVVVDLQGLDADAEDPRVDTWLCHSALNLCRSLLQLDHRPRLLTVTRGAWAVTPGEAVHRPGQATLWGFGRSLAVEHPELRSRLLDVAPELPAEAAAEVVEQALDLSAGEGELAWRAGGWLAARLESVPAPSSPPPRMEAEASYLVTGGTGGLGRAACRWLVERGARHLVLVARSAPRSEALTMIEGLQGQGVRVVVVQADVSEAKALSRRVRWALRDLPPLRGVLHTAGVHQAQPLRELHPDGLSAQLAPKLLGGWNLHRLTEHMELDFFVLYSSITGTLGFSGECVFSAGNSFLDALAEHRQSRGLPALSVAWGPWAEVGLAFDQGLLGGAEAMGLRSVVPEHGLSWLGALMGGEEGRALASKVEWSTFLERRVGRCPMLQDMRPKEVTRQSVESGTLASRLSPLVGEARSDTLELGLEQLLRRTLGLRGEQPVDPDGGFFEMGMDSLMAVEFARLLSQELEEDVPVTSLFDLSTLRMLHRHFDAAPGAVTPAVAPSGGVSLNEPIAIVGIGCRFPGGIRDPEGFWSALASGVDGVREVPRERWSAELEARLSEGLYVTRAGYLDDIGSFDAGFFRISPREAAQLSPSHRVALECTWEALEHAGLRPDSLEGSQTGVFLASMTTDYVKRAGAAALQLVNGYTLTGNMGGTLAGRVSFLLGSRGPSMSVETACSSSLVAVHLASQSLRLGESQLALAGGVNLILGPEETLSMCLTNALAPDGVPRTFDANASGYVRAEGCGILVLKRLSDAEQDGDRIMGVLRGTAVNHDGRSSGLTVPNGQAQQALIRSALVNASMKPAEVGLVEAHGTATPLGDPIEVRALAASYGAAEARPGPMLLGALKSNIGHTELAAGVAGLIKATLCVQRGQVPGNLHFVEPNPKLGLEETPFEVPTTLQPWPAGYARRVAGVSSFGVGGTNAHVLVEAPPEAAPAPRPEAPQRPSVLLLSGRSDAGLRANARRLAEHLRSQPEQPLAAVASTLCWHRQHHGHRGAVVAQSVDQAVARLESLSEGVAGPGVASGQAVPGRRSRLAFVFGGQGGQWEGMEDILCAREPAFREAWEACMAAFAPSLKRPELLHGVGADDAPPTHPDAWERRADVVQPRIFAMQVALAALWRSWGVEPEVVLGQSMGEVAAAQVCDALSLEDASRIICTRSRLARRMAEGRGGMAVVALSGQEAEEALAVHAGRLSIAVYVGPKQTVVSGDVDALEQLLEKLEREGTWSRRVKVAYASHCAHMDPLQEPLGQALASTRPQAAQVRFFSTVAASELPGEQLDTRYWVRNLREPVLLAQGLQALAEDGVNVFLELGPHGVLGPAVQDNAGYVDKEVFALGSMRRHQDGQESMLTAAAALHCQGMPVDWEAVLGPPWPLVDLPTYAWQRRRHWIDYRLPGVGTDGPLGFSEEAPEPEGGESLRSALQALPERERPAALRAQLSRLVNRVLGRQPDEPLLGRTNLYDLGMDSILGLNLAQALSARLEIELPGVFVAQHPLFGELLDAVGGALGLGAVAEAEAEVEAEGAPPPQWLVRPQPRPRARLRVFAFPYSAGGANLYRDWPERLPSDIEWVSLRAPGRESREAEAPIEDVDALLDALLPELLPALDRPFVLFGYSLGGLLAYALARRLRDEGHPTPQALLVAAACAPQAAHQPPPERLTDEGLLAFLTEGGVTSKEVLEDPTTRRMVLRRMRGDVRLLQSYAHQEGPPLPHPITVFAAREDPEQPFSETLGWMALSADEVKMRMMPGEHFFIHSHTEQLLAGLATELRRRPSPSSHGARHER